MRGEVGNESVSEALAQADPSYRPVDLAGPTEGGALEGSGRYVERGPLGQGGLGVVVEAFDRDLRSTVALKRPRDDRMTPSAIAALVREAQITAQLEHPSIPAVHALGIDSEGRPYFAMTMLGGHTLAELIEAALTDEALRRQLTTGRKLRIFLQVCYAVAFAHSRSVLHRDLKPDNVMVGAFGEVRLMDWGIAKLLDRSDGPDGEGVAPPMVETTASARATRAGEFLGTPAYAAPEQIEGRADIDERADIYALGAMLYKLLSGRPPIVGATVADTMEGVLSGRVPPIRSLVPLSDRLAAIVHKALARDREGRYPGVPALIADVEAVLEGRPVTALEEGALGRLGRVYFGRSLRVARLRTFEVDLFAWGSFFLGMTVGATAWEYATWWGWPLFVLGVLLCVPGLYAMMRKPRPDDPGVVVPFREGVSSGASLQTGRSQTPEDASDGTASLQGRAATPDERTETAPRD